MSLHSLIHLVADEIPRAQSDAHYGLTAGERAKLQRRTNILKEALTELRRGYERIESDKYFAGLTALVVFLLSDPHRMPWEYQGLGMIRLHLSPTYRLHVWHPQYAVKNVSTIHNHDQWGLTSTVIAGTITNARYIHDESGQVYHHARIRAGVGGGIEKDLGQVALRQQPLEMYGRGQSYSQTSDEIHESRPSIGAITIMRKTPTADSHGAKVFWQDGEWVSAEPRPATNEEKEEFACAGLEALKPYI